MAIDIVAHRLLSEPVNYAQQFIENLRDLPQQMQVDWQKYSGSTVNVQLAQLGSKFSFDFENVQKICGQTVENLNAALSNGFGRIDLVPEVTNALLTAARELWPEATRNYVSTERKLYSQKGDSPVGYYRHEMWRKAYEERIVPSNYQPSADDIAAHAMQQAHIGLLMDYSWDAFAKVFLRQLEEVPQIFVDINYYKPGMYGDVKCPSREAQTLWVYQMRVGGEAWLGPSYTAKLQERDARLYSAANAYHELGDSFKDMAQIEDISIRLRYASQAYAAFAAHLDAYRAGQDNGWYDHLANAYRIIDLAFAEAAEFVMEQFKNVSLPTTAAGHGEVLDRIEVAARDKFREIIELHSDLNVFGSKYGSDPDSYNIPSRPNSWLLADRSSALEPQRSGNLFSKVLLHAVL